ncbi:MAG: type I methionyl aminopeptidase [Elusimicrobiales bacterium]
MIEIKNESEISLIEKASKIVAETFLIIKEKTKPGVSTQYLDDLARAYIEKRKAKPAFLGYRGYPKTICVSVNDEVIHGIPSDKRIIEEGDVVSLDLGVVYDGYYSDAAITFIVGKAKSKDHERLVDVCNKALFKGLAEIRDGVRLGNVSNAIGSYVFSNGMDVLKEFTGHGIGRNLHEEPTIFNYGIRNTGPILHAGMTLAVEPMVTLGKAHVYIKDNGWTVATVDGSYAAHFEHTVCVTDRGFRILTTL